jgi:hypothetical protein
MNCLPLESRVTNDDQHNHDDQTDQMSINLPMGGGVNVSGPNASKLWGKVGWAAIIGASCVGIAHVIRAVGESFK